MKACESQFQQHPDEDFKVKHETPLSCILASPKTHQLVDSTKSAIMWPLDIFHSVIHRVLDYFLSWAYLVSPLHKKRISTEGED